LERFTGRETCVILIKNFAMNKIPKPTTKLIAVDAFIADHKVIINYQEVVFEKHLAQLFEISIEEIKKIVKKESKRFPDDFLLRVDDKLAFTVAGIFMLAGQVNTARGIEISMQMIEFIVGRKPNIAFDILNNKHSTT
jgi:hypothetical protein